MKAFLSSAWPSYVVINLGLGGYILGRETSVARDRSQDYKLYLACSVGSPIFVPYYICRYGLPVFGRDSRWER